MDPRHLARRDVLKLSALAAGGMAVAGVSAGCSSAAAASPADPTQTNTLLASLPEYDRATETLATDQMRITFLGSWYFPRLTQACNSVYVELGNGDAFVFDCGTGVMEKYASMRIPLGKMDKIFITHVHADHMSDLSHIYCFGPAYDRRSPLYVWGPSRSNVVDPVTKEIYEDGMIASSARLREAWRWHTESFGFQGTELANAVAPGWEAPKAPQDKMDAYDLVAFEVPWSVEGFVAYKANGVVIKSFPAVHARQGAVSYKLEWNGYSMIFTGDTRPNNYLVRQATGGVDVLIHEMTPPADIWTQKIVGLGKDDPYYQAALASNSRVIESSHTEQKAFGYVLSQLTVSPRLAVGTHFPASDDTIADALADIRKWYPTGPVTVAGDRMTLLVSRSGVAQHRSVVSDFAYPNVPRETLAMKMKLPKYNDGTTGDPVAQLDPHADAIPASLYNQR